MDQNKLLALKEICKERGFAEGTFSAYKFIWGMRYAVKMGLMTDHELLDHIKSQVARGITRDLKRADRAVDRLTKELLSEKTGRKQDGRNI